jgi:hypothetical protein
MATFVELAEAEYSRYYKGTGVVPMAGNSFTDALYDKKLRLHSPIYYQWKSGRGLMDGNYKLLSRDKGETWKLIDLSTDATELDDISENNTALRNSLISNFNQWYKSVDENDLPTAHNDTVKCNIDQISIDVLANDVDPDGSIDRATLNITQKPKYGTVVVNSDGTLCYTSGSGKVEGDTFMYHVKDDDGQISNTGVVAVEFMNTK